MSILFIAFFLLNTGITIALVAVYAHSIERKLRKIEEQHFDLILNLARQQGRTVARVGILEAQSGKR